MWTDDGMRIYAWNPAFAKRLEKLAFVLPTVWVNKGLIINVPEADLREFHWSRAGKGRQLHNVSTHSADKMVKY